MYNLAVISHVQIPTMKHFCVLLSLFYLNNHFTNVQQNSMMWSFIPQNRQLWLKLNHLQCLKLNHNILICSFINRRLGVSQRQVNFTFKYLSVPGHGSPPKAVFETVILQSGFASHLLLTIASDCVDRHSVVFIFVE